MILLIGGATHTGKTLLAQKLMEQLSYPCFSLDLLKMGLIRSQYTHLTPEDDDKLTDLLWPIVKEMIKTAIENQQNFIIEGCYFPFDWKKDFDNDYLPSIHMICLIMSESYIETHFEDIQKHANAIETRMFDDCPKATLLLDNQYCLQMCKSHGCDYIFIDQSYQPEQILDEVSQRITNKNHTI